jgi:hypothetical protein
MKNTMFSITGFRIKERPLSNYCRKRKNQQQLESGLLCEHSGKEINSPHMM